MQKSQIINLTWSFRVHGDTDIENPDLWPELRQKDRMKHSARRRDTTSAESNATSLDDTEYPKLGDRTGGNRNTPEKFCYSTDTTGEISVPSKMSIEPRKFNTEKRCRRTDKICINLQEALENTRCIRKINAKDLSKINVNIYKGCQTGTASNTIGRSKGPTIRKVRICISKGKRHSKMKRIILMHRELKAQINIRKREIFENEKVKAISRDVDAINFNALKITADPELDVDYVKHMAGLTFYGKNFRDPTEENVSESTVQYRPDVTQKFNDLSIQRKVLPNIFAQSCSKTSYLHDDLLINSTLLEQTLSLKIDDDSKEDIKPLITTDNSNVLKHSKNFREYCTNMLTPELNEWLEKFLSEILRLQRKQYERNPNKAKYKRRYYSGLKEVRKHVELRKVKFIIVAPDLERVKIEDGLDDEVYKLLETCKQQNVVVCFGLRRRKLGYYTHGKGLVSCVGVTNYNGTEEIFKTVLIELVNARNAFKNLSGHTDIIDLSKFTSDEYLLSENISMLMKALSRVDVQS